MTEQGKRWKEVMKLAERYGFIIQAYGGVATLGTHEEQKKAGIFEKTQVMNGTLAAKAARERESGKGK